MSGSGWIDDMLEEMDVNDTGLTLLTLPAVVAELPPAPERTPEEFTPEDLTNAHYLLDAPPPNDARDDAHYLPDASVLPLAAAVADSEAAPIPISLHNALANPDIANAWHSNCTTPRLSVGGDTVADSSAAENGESDAAVAERRNRRRAPRSTFQGDRQHRSSRWNAEPEVGNLGIFFGNWGARATLGGAKAQRRRMEKHDLQVLKNPAMIVVLAEAARETEEILKTCCSRGDPEVQGLESRDDHDCHVLRGDEESAILIAARKDNTTCIQLLEYNVIDDHEYMQRGRPKKARSRIMVCRIYFKQNVGHIGKEVVVAGVHGHYMTMKREWPAALTRFWNILADEIRSHGVQFVAGDFNMSLTQVPVELRSRGIKCDCIAWYPWRHDTERKHEQALGLDSCGIFYIGGNIKATLNWGLEQLGDLTAVAEQMQESNLDVYHGAQHPGQFWTAYRSKGIKESDKDKNLEQRLVDLLTPTTTAIELAGIAKRKGSWYCAYLRFKEKRLNKEEWLVDGEMHNGAHFPLCVFTKNASSRSVAGAMARAQRRSRGRRKGETAVAARETVGGKVGGQGTAAEEWHVTVPPGLGNGSWPTATTAHENSTGQSGGERRSESASLWNNWGSSTSSTWACNAWNDMQ